MPSEMEYIFNFRNVCVLFGEKEMGMKKVLRSRQFILELIDRFPFLTISILNLSTRAPADWKWSVRRLVTNKGGKKSKDLKG